MNDQQRISQALDKLFRTYRSFDQGETAAEVLRNRTERAKVYFEAVSSYSVIDVEHAVENFLAGSAPGHNPAYPPAAPLVGAECRRVMNLRLDSEHRARPALPVPVVQLSPEERQRMADLAERTVRALRTPDRQADIEAERRRHEGWARTNERFQPDMSPEVVRKRLGFTVGDPDGDVGVA
jgi:hypothetical protein